ncbi:DNA polymerase II large subunit [Candidatus Micrarchaeota archaeon]|nr:DNA polymerase II large subunit [Candidatus Micrarchaeota archaeon]MBU1166461.1 DNA polymerase II large subunit [Candidatus Micrarchaeota archaeon]MBU1886955.1 DNA polymerase II large subunit [Candidatus Micrarchaeota archaeon]
MPENYSKLLKDGLQKAYSIATEAREKGFDPSTDVEVRIAKDVAARVEGIVGPPNIAEHIRSLEKDGMAREDIAFEITKKIAAGELMKANKEMLIEQAVRTGLGILTEGVLVAPTEGIAKVKIKTNPDGSDYVAVYYAGPIRSAGGTAAALSLVLADIARKQCGVGDYRATETQIMRYIEEITVYETRCVHLQYLPSEKDIRVILENCPICIDGDPTEEIEVSAYRGVPGIDTNRVRGGMPLVLCEGVAAKSAKLLKYTKKLKLGWDWLEKIIKIKTKADKIEIKPDPTYMEGLVAGRPVFSHPSAKGGFRLRYGRSKNNGLMGKSVHPAIFTLLDDFLAYGTHMKIERPGKGCVVAAHDGLEPPAVKLKNGTVMKVRTLAESYVIKNDVAEVLFLGDMLCPYGDFLKSNHPLIPSGYCEEWWEREIESKSLIPPKSRDAISLFAFSKSHGIPLHPDLTFHWHDISSDQLKSLVEWLKQSEVIFSDQDQLHIREMKLPKSNTSDTPNTPDAKRVLEELILEHSVHENNIIITGELAYSLLMSLGALSENRIDFSSFDKLWDQSKDTLDMVNELSQIRIKAKAPTYIGARMGRPEKAKERKMDGGPHGIFPTGSFKNRSLSKQYRTLKSHEGERTVNLTLVRMRCTNCKKLGPYSRCHICGERAVLEHICQVCGRVVNTEIHCDRKTLPYDRRPVEIVDMMDQVMDKLKFEPADVKGVKGLSNSMRIPERLEKCFLRAKHNVYVFRDGTSRFDATDIVLTHFTPKEIGVSIDKLHSLGYPHDYLGNELNNENQTVAMKHQDIILSENAVEYFTRVTKFIDDLLVNVYGLPSFYNIKSKEDLVGHFAVGLSPHTSAGALCRIIGFTRATVGYGHPYFHTAKRRNCDGDEDSLMLLLDALLNFSRKYLDEKRGGTMDAPLVLSIEINPKEVDDEAHNIEMVSKYPLEFYEAAEKNTPPGDVKIKTVADVLGTPEQYNLPITHPGGTIDEGNIRTAYVLLDSIPDKIDVQFKLQKRIRPVDEQDAAERLILNHFIPDLYGNLRSFSRQTFRCVACNTIFRRVPLAGKCNKCGGNLLLTINKGGIVKYLKISMDIVRDFGLPSYLGQRLELIEKEIASIFEDDKIKQTGLSDFL